MGTKGSRTNPYTVNEHAILVERQSWNGGWVSVGGNIIYYTKAGTTYSGKCAKSNPVSEDIYSEMQLNYIWAGGWVTTGTQKRYITSGGVIYNSDYGTESNPWPVSMYNEMISNEIWEDAWVMEMDGTIYYVRNFTITLNTGSGCGCGCGCGCGSGSGSGSGCGCGSGSGSGSGCGCGSGDSSTNIYPVSGGHSLLGNLTNFGRKIGEVSIDWFDGNTAGQSNLSAVTLSIQMTDNNYSVKDKHLTYTWTEPYKVGISGCFYVRKIDKGEDYDFSVDVTYTIPADYRMGGAVK